MHQIGDNSFSQNLRCEEKQLANYLGKVTNYNTFTEVWNAIISLSSGKKTSPKKIILNINGPCSEPQILGTEFCKHFSRVSSNENYDPEGWEIKENGIKFTS